MKTRAVIIEDEPRAASRLKQMIGKCAPEMEVVVIIDTVRQGKEYFDNSGETDVIFCDVQLGDGVSFEIFADHKPPAPVIFTTAYDQYAIQAFKTNGIDYLMKPIDEQELCVALDKFRSMAAPVIPDLSQILAEVTRSARQFKSRFVVQVGEKIKSISIEEILCFYSDQKATFLLHEKGRSYVLDQTLDQIEEAVDSQQFFRVSRKYLVAEAAPTEIYQWTNSRLRLTIPGLDDHQVVVARERTKDYKAWLDR